MRARPNAGDQLVVFSLPRRTQLRPDCIRAIVRRRSCYRQQGCCINSLMGVRGGCAAKTLKTNFTEAFDGVSRFDRNWTARVSVGPDPCLPIPVLVCGFLVAESTNSKTNSSQKTHKVHLPPIRRKILFIRLKSRLVERRLWPNNRYY